MTVRRDRRSSRALRSVSAVGMVVMVGTLTFVSALGAVAAESNEGSGNLSVVVTDGTTPTPEPSQSPSVTPSPGAESGAGSTVVGTGSRTGVSSGAKTGGARSGAVAGTGGGGTSTGALPPAGNEVGIAGMIYIGGLEGAARMSPNPAEGYVDLAITVRNASQSTVDVAVTFWMTNLFGGEIDRSAAVAVAALGPGETRAVTTELHRAGQWTLLNAHAEVVPPEMIEGTPLTPVTRDATVLLFPWLVVLVIALAAAALGADRYRRRRAAAAAAGEAVSV